MHSILHIEDNFCDTQLIQRLLAQRPNITLLTSGSRRDRFTVAKERNPYLILLDVHWPDVTGFDVCTSLRSDPSTLSIPAMVSAYATPTQNLPFLDAGAGDCLTKPLDTSSLLHVIDKLLSPVSTANDAPNKA
jgi:two-component system cell cycle response regulator